MLVGPTFAVTCPAAAVHGVNVPPVPAPTIDIAWSLFLSLTQKHRPVSFLFIAASRSNSGRRRKKPKPHPCGSWRGEHAACRSGRWGGGRRTGAGTPVTRPGCPQTGSGLLATLGSGPGSAHAGGTRHRALWGGPRFRRLWAGTESRWEVEGGVLTEKFQVPARGSPYRENSSFQDDWPPAHLTPLTFPEQRGNEPRLNRLTKAHKHDFTQVKSYDTNPDVHNASEKTLQRSSYKPSARLTVCG